MRFILALVLLLFVFVPLKSQYIQDGGSIVVETVEWNLLEHLVTINRMVLDYSLSGDKIYLKLAKKYVIEAEDLLLKNEQYFTYQEIKQAKEFIREKKSLLLKGVSIANSPEETANFLTSNLLLKFFTQSVISRDLENEKKNIKNLYK